MTRPLSDRERAALDVLLVVDFAGAGELRAQAASAVAVGEKMIVELRVDQSLPKAQVINHVPVQAVVDGQGYEGDSPRGAYPVFTAADPG